MTAWRDGHLVISGTGRAGTTFLVEWLRECGLDVGDFRPEDYHPEARAGYERRLVGPGLPYVVKDPWLWTYLDDVDLEVTPIQRLVLPVRDLTQAAVSRVRRERQAISGAHKGWTTPVFGSTPGGMIWPVSTMHQAETLAVGFYVLIRWAVEHRIPLVLLDYPRILTDPAYAVAKLDLDPAIAIDAHVRTVKGD